jgi:hypothetical protein
MLSGELNRAIWFIVLTLVANVTCPTAEAQANPPVAPQYSRFFRHYVDHRSMLEKSLNLIGMTDQDVGRSFALIAGVSHYPRLPVGSRELRPAEADRDELVSYLQKQEFFDEVVVLWNDDMNLDNLSYFLHNYFPRRLAAFPKSRFLFAYSGHGFSEGDQAYLLLSSATSFADKTSAVNLRNVRTLIDDEVRSGYQVLVLLNSCYAGAFLTNTSFGGRYLPKHPGAHAITSGGAQERSWSDSRLGPGSVFFEKVLAGLGGAADRFPNGGDGIVTASELYAYLRQEVQISTEQRQCPQLGDLSARQSEGEFFFLNRARQVQAKLVPVWNPIVGVRFGRNQKSNDATPGGDTQLVTVAGTIPLTGPSLTMRLSGSFGDKQIDGVGGTLRVELSISHTTARYEQIELRTPFINQKFAGVFPPGFGKPPIPVELELSFFVVVSTSGPSPELELLPSSDADFQISPFYTSNCGFSCYYLEIIGTWTARGPNLTANGTIRSSLVGRGIGADTTARIDPAGYPKSVQLKGFAWHANSGGADIPDLVNATVDDVILKLSCSYISWPGVQGVDLALTSDLAAQ